MKAKEDSYPLHKKGDKFKIIKIENEEGLLPIVAIHLKTKEIYGFREGDLE